VLFVDALQQGLSAELQLCLAYQRGATITQQDIDALKTENQRLKTENSTLKTENNVLQDEITRLREQLKLAQQRHFGKKSEIGEPLAEEQDSSPLVQIAAHARKKKTKGRLIDLSLLPRRTVYHDLPEDEKNCLCCQKPLSRIGQDVSEQVEVLPQRLYVEEHIRYKYACGACETICMSPKEKAPIPKALAGGSLLTEVIVNKYQYHLPLYRQSKILASFHAIIPDNTLGNWVMQVGDGLTKIYNALWDAVLSAKYLQVDETPIKILNPEKKGYLWTYFTPYIGDGLVIFELSLTRGAAVAENRLTSYEGALQTDGYAGYTGLRKRKGIEGLGCLTHARRKFKEISKITKNQDGIAAQAEARLKPLYELEARMRDMNYNFKTRKQLRQRIARPILNDFLRWLKQVVPQVPPKSQLGVAIQYTFNQWPYIIKYLRHGMCEIDTNWVENKIRDIAVGRRNWLFMGNKDSGAVHALFYSLIASSIANDLNPRIYLHYLIMHIHDIRQGKIDPKQLLPHTIDQKLLEIFAQQQIDKAKSLLNSY
jgi:transposase